MQLIDRVQQSGWGALFLCIYSFSILYLESYNMKEPQVMLAAVLPSLSLIYLTIVFNDRLMETLVGREMRQAFLEIKQKTGTDSEFYWDAENDVQERFDQMDQRAHKYVVTIISGAVIALTLPFVVFWMYDLYAAVGSILASLVLSYLFCYTPYRYLQEVIKSSVKIYDSND